MSERTETAYLLIDAQNIDATVFDTAQLSVIRGGSDLLANAVTAAATAFEDRLVPLSTGASSGLFRVSNGQKELERLADDVADWLRQLDPTGTLCVSVEVCRASRLDEARELLYAKARYRQLKQPSVVPDSGIAFSPGPCGAQGRRRADPSLERMLGDNPRCLLSRSVAKRLDHGRRLRGTVAFRTLKRALDEAGACSNQDRVLLSSVLGRLEDFVFVDDLQTLAASTRYRALGNKIAVIYLDGNRFTAIQRRQAKTEPDQQRFDSYLRTRRAVQLASVLDAMLPGSRAGNAGALSDAVIPGSKGSMPQLRLEVLLWGGDEMTLVVPAWLGFDVMQRLYASSADWRFGAEGGPSAEPLTHAGGLVFCHANSPIDRMRALAQTLADDLKRDLRAHKVPQDFFDYLVLESIDYPVEPGLRDFRAGRYGASAESYRGALRPFLEWQSGLRERCVSLLDDGALTRGQVFALARRISTESADALFGVTPNSPAMPWEELSESPTRQLTAFERQERRLIQLAMERDDGEFKTALASLARALGCDSLDQRKRAWLWLHLAELWDYLAPRSQNARITSRGMR